MELNEQVETILSTKNFTDKAKDRLRKTMALIEFYQPFPYISMTKEEYIKQYVRVIESLNHYQMITLADLNEENEFTSPFIDEIRLSEDKTGNLDCVDGKLVPSNHGIYHCPCYGVTWNQDKIIIILEQENLEKELLTIYHELSHLTEGIRPFSIDSSVPFSFELEKMLTEGRCATREFYMKKDSLNRINVLEDSSGDYRIEAPNCYPLYSYLYQILQIIFGDEILEQMSQNENPKFDVIQSLKQRFPELPIPEMFAHIIYILSCREKNQHGVLACSIHNYARFQAKQIEWLSSEIAPLKNELETITSSLEKAKQSENDVVNLLGKAGSLEISFLEYKQQIRETIEKMYQAGEYTKEEYNIDLEELDLFTLQKYQENKELELQDIQKYYLSLEKKIKTKKQELTDLEQEKLRLESNQFPFILERICLKQPTLDHSFSFLEQVASKKIETEVLKNRQVALEKEKRLILLRKQIIKLEQKNTGLVI